LYFKSQCVTCITSPGNMLAVMGTALLLWHKQPRHDSSVSPTAAVH